MQVIVSCPLFLPDEPIDRNALEAHIQAGGRALRALAFQQCWQQYQAHAPACPCCQQPTTVADGSRACGRIFQPLDPLLGVGSGRATTGLHQAATALVAGERRVEPPTVPAQGLIALDGGYVQSHDNPAGMEGKVAVLATGRERVGRERWRLTGRRYVARFGSAATFGPLVYQVATEAGVAQAALLGCWDDASWISEIASWHFPTAERRLDLWHLLRRGAVEPARELVQQHLRGPAGVVFAGYLANQREWIVDAEMLLAQGEIVGSGAIEKGVDLVLNRRFKGRRGMRWWRANANAIVTLRTHIHNRQAEAA